MSEPALSEPALSEPSTSDRIAAHRPPPGILTEALPATNEPLRLAVRRLRWFRLAFERFVQATGDQIGCRFDLDEARLAEIFLRWLKSVEAQKPQARTDRHDYVAFAAGLMLRELCATLPIKAQAAPTRADSASAAAFWPEGYACTMFCLTVHSAAMRQEFHEGTELSDTLDDLRQWWSFRENVSHDPAFSAGFLQLVLGQQPNWMMPDVFRARVGQELIDPPAAAD